MATKIFVESLLNGIYNGVADNVNFQSSISGSMPSDSDKHLVMVLLDSASGTAAPKVLASSTPLPINKGSDKTKRYIYIDNDGANSIKIQSIPYSETFSVDENIDSTGTNATAFALLKVNGGAGFKLVQIPGVSGDTVDKYIYSGGVSEENMLFYGSITGGQLIQKNNSFNLSGVTLTIN